MDVDAISVVTRARVPLPPDRVWKGLVFYEEIGGRPPIHLRLLLPVPLRAEGRISRVGDEARCLYERGELRKRITRLEPGRAYGFEVAEQSLSFAGGLRLLGGAYAVERGEDGMSEIEVETRYRSPRSPRWLWRPVERAVCRSFHRYLLGEMRRRAAEG